MSTMRVDCEELAQEFFEKAMEFGEAQELLTDYGPRAAQFDVTDGKPFVVTFSGNGGVRTSPGTVDEADVFVEIDTATCEKMLRKLGTSFTQLRKDMKVWTRPCRPRDLAWFGMLVRIGQGR